MSVRQLVLIIPGGIIRVICQEQYLAKDVKDGTNKLHISMINQQKITTIVVIPTLKMVVYGVIPRILTHDGSTVLKLKVLSTKLYYTETDFRL